MTKEDCLGNYLGYCKFPCTMPESCDDFKNRHEWFCCPKNSHLFTHICKSDRDTYPTTFSIFARVSKQDKDTVTIDRFQKFGAIPVGGVTILRKDFEKYYKEYHDDI